MKKTLHYLLLFILFLVAADNINAQTELAFDQNPNYTVSRDKYLRMADSINAWHSTTPQETYKAIDYLEDKRIAREERRAFRRELRLERARHGWGTSYYDDSYYYNGYNRGGYYQPYYNAAPYHYGYRGYYHNSAVWNALPWILAAGLLCR